jgi:hypothetical protein
VTARGLWGVFRGFGGFSVWLGALVELLIIVPVLVELAIKKSGTSAEKLLCMVKSYGYRYYYYQIAGMRATADNESGTRGRHINKAMRWRSVNLVHTCTNFKSQVLSTTQSINTR